MNLKNKIKALTNPIIIIGLALLLTFSCKKDENIPLPTLSTNDISSIRSNTAKSGGTITSDGGDSIIARGVCWSTEQNPTIDDGKTINGSGKGNFTSNITGLLANTKYYVRAYATNNGGTAYGNELSFTTNSQQYSSMSATINGSSFIAISMSADGAVNMFIITGMNSNYRIDIHLPANITTGNHSLSFAGSYSILLMSGFDIYGSDSGTINITEYNIETGRFTATFSASCSDNYGNTKSITNGQIVAYL